MANERNIGHIVTVGSLSVFVRLDDDLKSLYKSGYEEIYPVARINSYIIIPVGADKIVAIVDRVMNREETDLSKSRGAIFLTESSRYLSATMIGILLRMVAIYKVCITTLFLTTLCGMSFGRILILSSTKSAVVMKLILKMTIIYL